MEHKIKVDIQIDGTPIFHFSNFTLEQRFNEHHRFQLRFNHDQIEDSKGISLDKSKDFMGRKLSIQWGNIIGAENLFVGIITKVEMSQSHGFQGDILVSGYSPGVLLDRGPDLGSYLDKNLKNIIEQATKDAPANDLKLKIQPSNTSQIDYMIQYRESDFDFINRLSSEYHEWFYYDGEFLNFGKPDELKEVKLVYGRDLHSIQYGMQVAPLSYQKFAYNSQQDKLLSAEPKDSNAGSPDSSYAIQASNKVFSKRYTEPLSVRVNSQQEINDFVDDEHKAIISDLVKISGNGDNPQVGIGKIVNISSSVKGTAGFLLQDFGKFLVTSISHQLDGVGHYQNTFEGVAAETEKLPVKHVGRPFADMQLATVLNNNDPKKQGRVKVQFKWTCTANDPTEWLRVLSPNAGNGDTGKNRGFLVVPEVGDQVIIAFEEGNIARPVVMGSVYHGGNAESGFTDSNVKGMTSRKGSCLSFDDLNHAVNLGTNQSNFVNIQNGGGVVNIKATSKIEFETGSSKITLNSDGTIDLIGITINIQGTTAINANAGKLPGKAVNIGELCGTTDVNIVSATDIKIESTNVTINGSAKVETTGGGGKVICEGGQVKIN